MSKKQLNKSLKIYKKTFTNGQILVKITLLQNYYKIITPILGECEGWIGHAFIYEVL